MLLYGLFLMRREAFFSRQTPTGRMLLLFWRVLRAVLRPRFLTEVLLWWVILVVRFWILELPVRQGGSLNKPQKTLSANWFCLRNNASRVVQILPRVLFDSRNRLNFWLSAVILSKSIHYYWLENKPILTFAHWTIILDRVVTFPDRQNAVLITEWHRTRGIYPNLSGGVQRVCKGGISKNNLFLQITNCR